MKGGPKTGQGRGSRRAGPRAAGRKGLAGGDDRYCQLSMALEAADIGLWDWDLGTDRVAMSANMKTLLDIGETGEDAPFETFLRVIHPEDRERVVDALKRAIRRRASFDEEFRARKSGPAVRWMRIRGGVSPGARGVPERVRGSIHDKTERKMAFDALAAARLELEEKVKERTRELLGANERLRREIAIKSDLQRQMMEVSEKEQRRIGQDLHDSLSQELGGIVFMGQVLYEKLRKRGLPEGQDAEKLVGHLQQALAHTRDLAKGLYPTLADGGLAAALDELAVTVRDLFGVRVDVRSDAGIDISGEPVTIHLFRIVQEAVNNAIRHGQATRVAVRLTRKKGGIRLTVADNGVGFPEKPNRKGLGLNIMEYRASSIGASFAIESRKGRGAVVTCVIPESAGLADLD